MALSLSLVCTGDNKSGTIYLTITGTATASDKNWALYRADISSSGAVNNYVRVATGAVFSGGPNNIYTNTTSSSTFYVHDRPFGVLIYNTTAPAATLPASYSSFKSTTTLPGYEAPKYYYRIHAYGNGGKSGSSTDVYRPASGYFEVETITGNSYNLSDLPTFRIPGYILHGWAEGQTATQGETVYSVSYPVMASSIGETNAIHAVWTEISHFTWYAGGDSIDDQNIAEGQPREMTAAMWASFCSVVEALGRSLSLTLAISRVEDGSAMLHAQYNSAVSALTSIRTAILSKARDIALPDTVDTDDLITALQFNGYDAATGKTSLKYCFNQLLAAAKT